MAAAVLAIAAFSATAAARPLGALAPVAGAKGCISDGSMRGACTPVNAINGSQSIALSPDGSFAYVASVGSESVTSFSRNAASGALKQLTGSSGCISGRQIVGCAPGQALRVANYVAVSPDGRNVYVASFVSQSIDVFARNPTTGALAQLPGPSGCISSSAGESACAPGRALDGADSIAISPDGTNVYVTAFNSGAVAIFTRDPATGSLSPFRGIAGCISSGGVADGCIQGSGLDGAASVAISPDGQFVYVTARQAQTVTIYRRDPATGQLTQLPGVAGCVAAGQSRSCTPATGMPSPNSIDISSDGSSAYVPSIDSDDLAVFARNRADGTLTQLAGRQGCFSGHGRDAACQPARALSGPFAVGLSPDGSSLYAASFRGNAATIFSRDLQSGALSQLAGANGCAAFQRPTSRRGSRRKRRRTVGQLGCVGAPGLSAPHEVVVSPDGAYAYVVGHLTTSSVAIFKRTTR